MKTSNPIDTFFSYIENKDEDAAIHYLAEQGKNFNVNCVKHGCLAIIYAVEKGGMAQMKKETYSNKAELEKAVSEYEEKGFKVYYNEQGGRQS